MADPMSVVPYYDPFDDDTKYGVNVLMFDENPSPTLSAFPSKQEEEAKPLNLNFKIEEGIAEQNDPLDDPFFLDMFDSPINTENDESGASLLFLEEPNNVQDIPQPENFRNPVEMSVWPVAPAPYTCTCCQVLREITHTNGIHVTKLEIHGRLGMICHAILENRYGGEWSNQSSFQMFDFSRQSLENVREFLNQYCEERRHSGYTMLQDPLLTFYEALCVGLNDDESLDIDDYFQASTPTSSGEYQPEQAEPLSQKPMFGTEEMRQQRSFLAMQRERTGRLTVKDLSGYFNLPIDEAAKRMNLCPTVMKKICRKHGVLRWPYRKIKSIEKKLASKRASCLTSNDPEERMRFQAEIEVLEKQLADIFAKVSC